MDTVDLNKCIEKIIKAIKDDIKLDNYTKGFLGNIAGSLKQIKIEIDNSNESNQFLLEELTQLKNDPVICAYLSQKEKLENKLKETHQQLKELDNYKLRNSPTLRHWKD